MCRSAHHANYQPPVIYQQSANRQPPAPTQLRPLQPREISALVPQQGIPPFRVPSRPLNEVEAEILKNAYTSGLNRRSVLVQKVSHLHLVYFHSPNTSDWRCVDCYQGMAEDWKYAYLHCVGLTVEFKTPRCPGCRKSLFIEDRVYRCSACSIVFTYHEKEIQKGCVFRHP